MTKPIPKITYASFLHGTRKVVIRFSNRAEDVTVDLTGWIATGGDILAPLNIGPLFEAGAVSDYADAIEWGEAGGDLAIDAAHLEMLAEEQRPFTNVELADWQTDARLSNSEASALLDVAPSTWARYKAGADIPASVAIAVRAAKRDPMILQARLRPAQKPGRPRKQATVGQSFVGSSFVGEK